MYRHQHVSLHDIKKFLLAHREVMKKMALAIGAACALIMAAAFHIAEKIFAHTFEETPLLPGALDAWYVAQCFGAVADFFKDEADENIRLMHGLT